jgi:protein TonB
LDNEALKLVKNMPKWKPGLEDNEKADFSFILPIKFRLQGRTKH